MQIPIAPRTSEQAVAQALKSAPTFQALGAKGLIRKHYLNGPGGGGGVYFWRSRADAEAWYTEQWRAQTAERFGAVPTLSWYDNLVTVDNVAGTVEVEN